MTDAAWQLEYSVETEASPDFAWSFWTNVTNWDDPPAQFVLDGPFAADSHGTTVLPGQETRRWTIRDVQPGKSFVIEMLLDRATLSFEWGFEAASDRRTRLTQRITLSGENSADYVEAVQAGFAPALSEGMNRIAKLIASQARMLHL
jgi:hypothetical protein